MSISLGSRVQVDCPATPSLDGKFGTVVGHVDGGYDVTGFLTYTVSVELSSRQRVFNFNADELTEVASA